MPVPTILQIIPALHSGGAEKTAIDIALAIRDEGWRALVASSGGGLVNALDEAGIDHIDLPLGAKNPLAIWANARALTELIARENIDIVHARSRAPAWAGWFATRRTSVRFVTTYHGAYKQAGWRDGGPLKEAYNSVMAKGERVIGNSNWTAELVRQRHPDAAGRIIAIPRGTDFEEFAPGAVSKARLDSLARHWSVESGDVIALHLARITPLKDQTSVVAALSLLAERHPRLKVVLAGAATGHDDYLARLHADIAQAGLEKRVIIPGHCDDPAAAISLADIILSASRQPETFGRVAVEAGACEKPVIVTDIGAVGETVLTPPAVREEERTGWKVPPEDPEALAETLDLVLNLDATERAALGVRARNYVTARFSTKRMCEETLAVYRDLMATTT